jgi:hypothetical protein
MRLSRQILAPFPDERRFNRAEGPAVSPEGPKFVLVTLDGNSKRLL